MQSAVLLFALVLGSDPATPGLHRAVGLLNYLEGDYPPAVAEHDASELKEQGALAGELVGTLEQAGPAAAPYLEGAKQVAADIAAQVPGEQVAHECRALAERIRAEQHLQLWPRRPPSLADGETLWRANCASCHGPSGDGQGPAGKGLQPPPADFHAERVMGGLTPYQAFNTLSYGVTGTAMVAFPQLSEDQRWALSFFVFTHRQPNCDHAPPRASLETLATSTDAQLAAKYGEREVACLRRALPREDAQSSIAMAREKVAEAARLARQGDQAGARHGLTDAYLSGVEPVEPGLKLYDPQLLAKIENGFSRTREAVGTPGFDPEVRSLDALLAAAGQPHTAADFWSVLVAALLILLREGFEAMVVVGALLAVLKKLAKEGRPEAVRGLRAVHLGWILALLLGALGFVLGHEALAAANREWMETVVSFVAVGLLLYAVLWLNRRSNVSRLMGELRGKMQSAFSSGSLLGLFTISFTAVGRESFEAAVFLQGLAVDSLAGTVWGACLGLLAMLLFVLLVRRVGFVLPMKTLFNASTVLLVATALMLLGKGMHGLEELGVLSQRPLPFFSLEPLGIFADRWTLLPQVVLLAAALWLWRAQPRRGAMG